MVFDKAKEILLRDFEKDYDWLVIDEIGPLELNNSGLEPAITEIFSNRSTFKGNILIVVRDKVFNDLIAHYGIQNDFEIFQLKF